MTQAQEAQEYRIVTSHELKAEITAKREKEFKLRSNISALDKAVDGFVEGELITLSGPTKHGKTLFAQSLTVEFCKQNAFPLWFSYEVTPKYFLQAFPDLPLFYLPRRMKMNALAWVYSKIIESLKQYHTRVVFIDHLHYLVDMARQNNMSIEVGMVIRKLKMWAVDNGLIIFLLCHTKKGASVGEELTHESIRDSSFVAQESDCVLLIKRDTKHPETQEAKLLVDFHRRTGSLHTVVNLIKTGGYLREMDYLNKEVARGCYVQD
jgi:archaellum biogenesis ATPase FlaH